MAGARSRPAQLEKVEQLKDLRTSCRLASPVGTMVAPPSELQREWQRSRESGGGKDRTRTLPMLPARASPPPGVCFGSEPQEVIVFKQEVL